MRFPYLSPARALLWMGFLGLLACSDSSAPEPSGPSSLEKMAGDGVPAPYGTVLPSGPTVRVLDASGAPLAGVSVHFTVVSGGGEVAGSTVPTDGWGEAQAIWVLGWEGEGPQRLRASAGELSVEFQAQAVAPVPGGRHLGRSGYVEYLPGDLPLVLSAGHGGELRPASIPDRSWGTTAQDMNTLDLALRIREAVRAGTGGYPHLVISHLHRIKLDPNREIEEAAQGSPHAERAWWEYHTFLDAARRRVEEAHGDGFYLDIHGHGHTIQRVELGYLLTSGELASSDVALSASSFVNKSSVRALVLSSGRGLAELIRGPSSLGTLLEDRAFPAVPSAPQPGPASDPYFSGGYSTVRHGSRNGGSVSGAQVECNFTGVRDSAENRQRFAVALTESLRSFFQAHFGRALSAAAPAGLLTTQTGR